MRIVRLAEIPVIVRIRRRDEVTLVVPSDTPADDVLAVACLVLTGDEFAELEANVADAYQSAATPGR
jgi:hypothetical protein